MEWEVGVSRCKLLYIEWIKMWYIYITEYYSTIKKNEIMPFPATLMQLETVILILSEVKKRKTNII